jgi:hypothetical protein
VVSFVSDWPWPSDIDQSPKHECLQVPACIVKFSIDGEPLIKIQDLLELQSTINDTICKPISAVYVQVKNAYMGTMVQRREFSEVTVNDEHLFSLVLGGRDWG